MSAVACYSGGPSGSTAAPPTTPFRADPPSVYVAKVKSILVGLPPTDDEVRAVAADPAQLAGLIKTWMGYTQYTQKMTRFFQLAFQQTQIGITDFADQAYPSTLDPNVTTAPLLAQNAQESFARTAMAMIANHQPLTDAMTTHQIMMTTALKSTYAFLDDYQVDDAGAVTDRLYARLKARGLTPSITVTAKGPVPIADTLDPASPNYMHWYDPDVTTFDAMIPGCQMDPVVYPKASALTLFWLMNGALDGRKVANVAATCTLSGGSAAAPQFIVSGATNDFNDWQLVTIRQPNGNEPPTSFYDLPSLRATNELVLSVPRVGFFSTPAFFANWQTNTSNQMRVTMNQALIVALGAAVDGSDTTTAPKTTPGIDLVHAADDACFNCHQTLDPTRSILAATFSWNYHSQADAKLQATTSQFTFRGVTAPVSNIDDFGKALANHPLFAQAWVEKLCFWANSSACDPSDPLFQQIVSTFKTSYDWNEVVVALLSSPIVTNTASTVTAQTNGQVVAVSRRDHLCAALNARIGFTDVCGLDALGGKNPSQGVIPEIVSGLPSDGYGRGGVEPILPNVPTLFYRAGTENICEAVAVQVVDAKPQPSLKQWSSAAPDAAIAEFVSLVMGLTASDPRAAAATTTLRAHFDAALAKPPPMNGAKFTPTQALQSTFIAACMSPSAISMGM